jgi:hypothetical protein
MSFWILLCSLIIAPNHEQPRMYHAMAVLPPFSNFILSEEAHDGRQLKLRCISCQCIHIYLLHIYPLYR